MESEACPECGAIFEVQETTGGTGPALIICLSCLHVMRRATEGLVPASEAETARALGMLDALLKERAKK